MRNIKIKETYLLVLIVMGLISMAVYSTYALFTASTTINNVVGMTATLTTDSNILEYEMVTVGPRETKIIELTVNNSYSSSLYYGAWYEILSSDTDSLNIGLYTEKNSTASSGQIAASATKTLLVGISNSSTEEMMVNIGTVGSLTSNLNLASTRTLLSTGWNIPAKVTLNNLGLTSSSNTPDFSVISPYYEIVQTGELRGEEFVDEVNIYIVSDYYSIMGNDTGRITLVHPDEIASEELTEEYLDWYMCDPLNPRESCEQVYKIVEFQQGSAYEEGEWEDYYELNGSGIANYWYISDSYTFDSQSGMYILDSPELAKPNFIYSDVYTCWNQATSCDELIRIDSMSTSGQGLVSSASIKTSIPNETLYPSLLEEYTLFFYDDDTGIYAAEDDFGTSYYFRGNVRNNYVSFAGNFWRIVRINGDGSIRLIIDVLAENGEYDYSGNMANEVMYSEFSGDNTYAGYMYGTAGASTYAATHSNTNSSLIKEVLDDWYVSKIENRGYSDYIVDSIYCNDRSLSSGTGIGTDITYYGGYNRLITNKSPILTCPQLNDKFTLSSNIGNGKLTYPIGLITADELAMGGAVYGTENAVFYLNGGGATYLTMTPRQGTGIPSMFGVSVSGTLAQSSVVTTGGVRPVITISADAITSGSGTTANPFRVG